MNPGEAAKQAALDALPALLGCGINSRTMSKRPDGTLYRQVTEDIYYVERPDGTVWAEVAHLPQPVELDREVLTDAAAQWANALLAAVREANLAAARLAEKRAKVTVPEEADEPWAVALAVALRGAVV